MAVRRSVPEEALVRLRAICARLPDAYEETAWVGVRWRVRRKTFGHVLVIEEGWPPAYAAASGLDGRACVLTFRTGDRLFQPERFDRPPFFRPPWFPDIMGLTLEGGVDWADVEALVRESYRLTAPKKLAAQLA
jgi:hypothetical protein